LKNKKLKKSNFFIENLYFPDMKINKNPFIPLG